MKNNIFITGFWGWNNIKWFIRELNKMYSGTEVSFFSKKRIEGGIAFIILQWGMIFWMVNKNVADISAEQLLVWAGIESVICGYALSKIEQASAQQVPPSQNKPDKNEEIK